MSMAPFHCFYPSFTFRNSKTCQLLSYLIPHRAAKRVRLTASFATQLSRSLARRVLSGNLRVVSELQDFKSPVPYYSATSSRTAWRAEVSCSLLLLSRFPNQRREPAAEEAIKREHCSTASPRWGPRVSGRQLVWIYYRHNT